MADVEGFEVMLGEDEVEGGGDGGEEAVEELDGEAVGGTTGAGGEWTSSEPSIRSSSMRFTSKRDLRSTARRQRRKRRGESPQRRMGDLEALAWAISLLEH